MSNCYDLNLKIEPLNDKDILNIRLPYHIKISLNEINPELKTFLYDRGLKLLFVELFHSIPKQITTIHVDSNLGDFTKINYMYGGKNSYMNWYKPIGNFEKKQQNTAIGTPLVNFSYKEVELLEKKTIGFPSLIQVGIPHNINNFEEHRFCLSLIYKDIKTNKRPSMAESLELFKDIIIGGPKG